MESVSNVEFDVNMTCDSCGNSVKKALQNLDGVKSFEVDVSKQSVIVESNLPSQLVKEAIESTGKQAVLKGIGSANKNLAAAVAEIRGCNNILGVVRFHQTTLDSCIIDGTIDGLSKGEHGLHIHEFGDLSDGCKNLGEHFNPRNLTHGGRSSEERHYGDLGNISADENGRASFRFEDHVVKVPDIIGRSLAVSSRKDDLGQEPNGTSHLDGNSGQNLACAIIARASGLFSNPKRICQCDGVSVWEERDVPSAGQGRSTRKVS